MPDKKNKKDKGTKDVKPPAAPRRARRAAGDGDRHASESSVEPRIQPPRDSTVAQGGPAVEEMTRAPHGQRSK
eukprot:5226969-Pyramimonas_sp.AAC.1